VLSIPSLDGSNFDEESVTWQRRKGLGVDLSQNNPRKSSPVKRGRRSHLLSESRRADDSVDSDSFLSIPDLALGSPLKRTNSVYMDGDKVASKIRNGRIGSAASSNSNIVRYNIGGAKDFTSSRTSLNRESKDIVLTSSTAKYPSAENSDADDDPYAGLDLSTDSIDIDKDGRSASLNGSRTLGYGEMDNRGDSKGPVQVITDSVIALARPIHSCAIFRLDDSIHLLRVRHRTEFRAARCPSLGSGEGQRLGRSR